MKIFWLVFALTVLCGVGASAFAILPVFVPDAGGAMEMVQKWHSTLSYIFSAGAGSIFTMIGLGLGDGGSGSA